MWQSQEKLASNELEKRPQVLPAAFFAFCSGSLQADVETAAEPGLCRAFKAWLAAAIGAQPADDGMATAELK